VCGDKEERIEEQKSQRAPSFGNVDGGGIGDIQLRMDVNTLVVIVG
jgi:hypothetical protein